MDSVLKDGLPFCRVPDRMARDFWVHPSESSIRLWVKRQICALPWKESYEPWVVENFSGVLCVDEVYQGKIALFLAVDPKRDRLVGYQLLRGPVSGADAADFLGRLRDLGIFPDEIVTDGSSLYPETLAMVWPQAAHQLCLFHQTRNVVKAGGKALRKLMEGLPKMPTERHGRAGPISRQTLGNPNDRAMRIAIVHALRQEGRGFITIARMTGHGINTVRSWLRGTVRIPHQLPRVTPEVLEAVKAGQSRSAVTLPQVIPPSPWKNWDEIQITQKRFKQLRYTLLRRTEHLSEQEKANIDAILQSPLGKSIQEIREFVHGWYGIWREMDGQRPSREEAGARWDEVRKKDMKEYPTLNRIQDQMTPRLFHRLAHAMGRPDWQTTSNAAERMGRRIRRLQGPHLNLRTNTQLEGAIQAQAIHRSLPAQTSPKETAMRSPRGRPLKNGVG